MTNKSKREIISRRDRPAKAPLSRDVIIATALNIIESEGWSGLSLRKVATALDTGAASLYVYVDNLQDLHSLMLDRALGAIRLPEPAVTNWRDRLKVILVSYLHLLYEKPGLARIAMSTMPSGANYLRIIEHILAALKEGGIEDDKAAWGVDLLTLYVTAVAAEQSSRDDQAEVVNQADQALRQVSALDFPLVFALKEQMLSGEGDVRVDWAIDVMINGILATPLPAHE
jgi:AcrR family transcriptional regulator